MPKPAFDIDPIETKEWSDALASVIRTHGEARGEFLINQLLQQMKKPAGITTAYLNTLSPKDEAKMPFDNGMAKRIEAINRWNALMIVLKGGKKDSALGGHLATYASAATLYEVAFNYFLRGNDNEQPGDLVFFQAHAAPGIYARAFLEGRLTEENLLHYRQETSGKGLSSYPHPWLMPHFWQFPTGSMGLGALQSIFQAQLLHYIQNRGLAETQPRKVWAFCGDGEMDETESLGALGVAGREHLDNLIFVINCNLLRLDGPVRGNGKIIQELEAYFHGAGWHVIKAIWGSGWDELLAKDQTGLLQQRMMECLDGEYQNYTVKTGDYFRQHFFGKYPELLNLVKDKSDEQLKKLTIDFAGHDPQKMYAAYHAAQHHVGQPTVILVKSIKGYSLPFAQGLNNAHQQKKATFDDLKTLRNQFNIPLNDEDVEHYAFYRPDQGSEEISFLKTRRASLNGFLPHRHFKSPKLTIPDLAFFKTALESSGEREISSTMAFVRILGQLLKDKNISSNIVPIVADEARTFGMEGLFRQIGIYSPDGQNYEPVDKEQMLYYRETKEGQLLEHGINECAAIASWMAAATSYSNNQLPLIPFYIFYSMFGFQRIGDFAWAAADMRARGFLIGATAGRTTLAGEGLQHNDGHSHILASVIPTCMSYDPTFSYELAVIIQEGLRRMYANQEDVYYYITVTNENYHHPAMPENAQEGIIKGMYLFKQSLPAQKQRVHLLGSGSILLEVIRAADLLAEHFNIGANIWSVTSFTELRREGLAVERENLLHPEQVQKSSYVTHCLAEAFPVIAATDYIRTYPDQIRNFISQPYYTLGTDGFGRSDTRANLRRFYEMSAEYIAYTALNALADEGKIEKAQLNEAKKIFNINSDVRAPWLL